MNVISTEFKARDLDFNRESGFQPTIPTAIIDEPQVHNYKMSAIQKVAVIGVSLAMIREVFLY